VIKRAFRKQANSSQYKFCANWRH